MSPVCLRRATLGSTQKDSVGSLGGLEGQLVKGETFSSGGNDTLAGVFGEGKGADGHLGAFHHTNIVRDLSDNDSDLTILVDHVLGKTVEANWWLVHLAHVKALHNGGTKFRIGTARQEFVKLDQKLVVRVLGLDDLGRDRVPCTASTGFQINTHLSRRRNDSSNKIAGSNNNGKKYT